MLLQQANDESQHQSGNDAHKGNQQTFGEEDAAYLLAVHTQGAHRGDVLALVDDEQR